MAKKRPAHIDQLALFESGLPLDSLGAPEADPPRRPARHWPSEDRVPINVPRQRTTRSRLFADIRAAEQSLLSAGYASLDELITLLAEADANEAMRFRLLLGNEPFTTARRDFTAAGESLPAQVQRYWLERGISIYLSARLIRALRVFDEQRVEVRWLDHLHAKIYCCGDAVITGSSNFTRAGLTTQLECNVRLTRTRDARVFRAVSTVAENYWADGTDYTEGLRALLDQLLRVVTWQEALARAAAELLEGTWLAKYLADRGDSQIKQLWPFQREGIAQALWVLENVGSVLVADPTGSGKTRMATHLLRAARERLWSGQRMRSGLFALACPPLVQPAWQRESLVCGVSIETVSHGALSHPHGRQAERVAMLLARAQLLTVDEAHNFLSRTSRRTQTLLSNAADQVVLLTATPLNRTVSDLLRLVDMLGPDNLDDETLALLEDLVQRQMKKSSARLASEEIETLRRALQRFVVRRTKRQLKAAAEAAPEHYLDDDGQPCSYPRHASHLYATGETDADRAIAREIHAVAATLTGVSLVRKSPTKAPHEEDEVVDPVVEPDIDAQAGLDEMAGDPAAALQTESSSDNWVRAIAHLAIYHVMSRLRSSRAALIEHLAGTVHAVQTCGLTGATRDRTGSPGRLERLRQERDRCAPTLGFLDAPPAWASSDEAWRVACDEEAARYERILALASRLSDARERTKAHLLARLAAQGQSVIAFDHHLMSLAAARAMLTQVAPDLEVITAVGGDRAAAEAVQQALSRTSNRRAVALCSDSLAEGVNLQGARCVVHLEMPTVIRIAEQRVGRVDRMDSPHREIEAWWPAERGAFAIKSDERFLDRYRMVDTLLGSNMPLPPDLAPRLEAAEIDPEALVDLYERTIAENRTHDGLDAAFAPVQGLIEGDAALVPPEVYAAYRTVTAQVVAGVALVDAQRPWAFFAVSDGKGGAPRWVYLDDAHSQGPVIDLDLVVRRLRERLGATTENVQPDAHAMGWLEAFVARMARVERQLLPKKRQRALEQMEQCLSSWKAQALQANNVALAKRWGAIERTIAPAPGEDRPRLDEVAGIWLDLVAPLWHEALKRQRRWRLRRLALLDPLLKMQPLCIEAVEQRFRSLDAEPSLDERIKAAIIGVPPAAWQPPVGDDIVDAALATKRSGEGRPTTGSRSTIRTG